MQIVDTKPFTPFRNVCFSLHRFSRNSQLLNGTT